MPSNKKTTKKPVAAGQTVRKGTSPKLKKTRGSKYESVREALRKLKPGEEHLIPVPKGMDSERFRNNIYHATCLCRDECEKGTDYFTYARTDDLKHVIVTFEKE